MNRDIQQRQTHQARKRGEDRKRLAKFVDGRGKARAAASVRRAEAKRRKAAVP